MGVNGDYLRDQGLLKVNSIVGSLRQDDNFVRTIVKNRGLNYLDTTCSFVKMEESKIFYFEVHVIFLLSAIFLFIKNVLFLKK